MQSIYKPKRKAQQKSDLNRDKTILDTIKQAYDFQFERREKLDAKLNNFIAIIGTIATINVGIGFFVFERISPRNSLYPFLVLSFIAEIALFALAMTMALHGYAPMDLYHITGQPERFIKKYKNLTETHVIREVAATMAKATQSNLEVNLRKTNTIRVIFMVLILAIIVMVTFSVLVVLALMIGTPTNSISSIIPVA